VTSRVRPRMVASESHLTGIRLRTPRSLVRSTRCEKVSAEASLVTPEPEGVPGQDAVAERLPKHLIEKIAALVEGSEPALQQPSGDDIGGFA
jgi:hypothetical protein